MKPLPYIWPYALVFWAIFVWAFLPEFGETAWFAEIEKKYL